MACPGTTNRETRLPRAMSSGCSDQRRTVICAECGLSLRQGNLARHKKAKHGGQELLSRGPKEKLIIRLPREGSLKKRGLEEEAQEEVYKGLMSTPQSEEECRGSRTRRVQRKPRQRV